MMLTFTKYIALAAVLLFVGTACTGQQQQEMKKGYNDEQNTEVDVMTTAEAERSDMAVATIRPTKGNEAMGTVMFSDAANGIRVQAQFSQLPEGKHGLHIHLYGDCTAADGTSAGTHFNFMGSSTNPSADIDRITGDLGNLMANASGNASIDTTISAATLTGAKSIIGRGIIVHANGNDTSQPPIGAAGARLGCGVIGTANPDGNGGM